MTAAQFSMPDLLERAGFHIRGRRADCAHCTGGSRLTVSFTDKVCYCHRCGWRANTRMLARELGLLSDDPESRRRFAADQRQRERQERVASQFETWRDSRLAELSDEYFTLGRRAAFGRQVLASHPDCEQAWDALARYYHSEARLSRALDFLTCARASPWLARDAKIVDVFSAWQGRAKEAA